MHCLSPLFYMEAKFGPLEKWIKRLTSIERYFSVKTADYIFLTTQRLKKFWKEFKAEAVDKKLRKYK